MVYLHQLAVRAHEDAALRAIICSVFVVDIGARLDLERKGCCFRHGVYQGSRAFSLDERVQKTERLIILQQAAVRWREKENAQTGGQRF